MRTERASPVRSDGQSPAAQTTDMPKRTDPDDGGGTAVGVGVVAPGSGLEVETKTETPVDAMHIYA